MTPYEQKVLRVALRVAEKRLNCYGPALTSPHEVRDYLRLWAAAHDHEAFGVIWLNSKHQILAVQELFQGSIDSASVYPRVVVKCALGHNAAAVVLFHNHPSGESEPSRADVFLTTRLKEALALVEVQVLDHLVVGATITSLAERGEV